MLLDREFFLSSGIVWSAIPGAREANEMPQIQPHEMLILRVESSKCGIQLPLRAVFGKGSQRHPMHWTLCC